MSLESKLKFADDFESLLYKKSILKISVSDVTSVSGLSRQTFYNHFKDINDLVYWMHAENLHMVEEAFWKNDNFCLAFERGLQIMQSHKTFYTQIIRKEGLNSFQEMFCLHNVRLSSTQIRRVSGKDADKSTKFLLELYWRGASRKVADWISDGMQTDIQALSRLFYEGLPHALRRYWPHNP